MFDFRSRRGDWIAVFLLFLLALAVFGEFLFTAQRQLSAPDTDIAAQFLSWREFAARELSAGRLPLWNPHIFSGAPFLGGFQAALLYPPTLLYVLLPVVTATNATLALHTFLMGAFAYAWARGRALSVPSAFFVGVVLMFSGAFFPHLYAGHLSNLCTMAWVPLLFLAIDRIFDTRRWSWALFGMGVLAMMILAGHPQYVYFTGVAAGLYTLLQWVRARERWRVLLLLAALVAGGCALVGAQLGAGWQAASETVRSGGLPYEIATSFSFPPENLLTVLAPGLFGPMGFYWGRCYLWEMTLYISATGLLLAAYGVWATPKARRRWALTMFLALLVLALGAYTPLFSLLYHGVPGFSAFRGWSKFTFQATLFLALLAGYGVEALLRRESVPRGLAMAAGAMGLVLLAGGFAVGASGSPEGAISRLAQAMIATGQSYLQPGLLHSSTFLDLAAATAAESCWASGGALLLAALMLSVDTPHRRWRCGLIGLATVEMFLFALSNRAWFDVDTIRQPQIEAFLANTPGDYRTLNFQPPNHALSLGSREMWGSDPGVVKRYAEWMFFTQGLNPDQASQLLPLRTIHPLYAPMLRAGFVFGLKPGGTSVFSLRNPGPRAFLAGEYRVLPGRKALFKAMNAPEFNPTREALLESEPDPKPESGEGSVRVVGGTTDSLSLEVDLPRPSLLVLTELWTTGWRARDLKGERQYTLQPVDYILQGVPLPAGSHRLIVEYVPKPWRIGVAVSLVSLAGYVAAWVAVWRQRSRRSGSAHDANEASG